MHQWGGRWSGAGPVLICFWLPREFWVGHVNLRLGESHEPHDDFSAGNNRSFHRTAHCQINSLSLSLSLVTITIMKNARGSIYACEEPRKDLKSAAYGAQRTGCCSRNG